MKGRFGARPSVGALPLTGTQLEILDRLSRSEGVPQIAREMQLSVNTVRRHVRTSMERLDADTPTHAVAEAFRRGLLTTVGASDVR